MIPRYNKEYGKSVVSATLKLYLSQAIPFPVFGWRNPANALKIHAKILC